MKDLKLALRLGFDLLSFVTLDALRGHPCRVGPILPPKFLKSSEGSAEKTLTEESA